MVSMAPEPAATGTEVVGPQVAILFVGVSLFLGMACRHLLHGTRVPYTVALLLLGIGIGGLGQLFFCVTSIGMNYIIGASF